MFAARIHDSSVVPRDVCCALPRLLSSFRVAVVGLAGLALSGCATVSGSQRGPASYDKVADTSPYASARAAYNQSDDAARGNMTRERFRNHVIGLYRDDANQKYERFKKQLTSADRGSALALDLVLIALTGATALVGSSSTDDMATVTAIAAGARGTIDKRLFFDRTMPAVIAAMDARRMTIDSQITVGLQLPDDQYTLDNALTDIDRLFAAGTINDGVAQITADAVASKAAAEARLKAIREGCTDVTPESAGLNRQFRELFAGDPVNLAKAAQVVELKVPDGTPLTPSLIMAEHEKKFCSDAKRRIAIDLLKEKIAAN